MFNVFDTQDVTGYDSYTEAEFLVPNPDFGRVIRTNRPASFASVRDSAGSLFGWARSRSMERARRPQQRSLINDDIYVYAVYATTMK